MARAQGARTGEIEVVAIMARPSKRSELGSALLSAACRCIETAAPCRFPTDENSSHAQTIGNPPKHPGVGDAEGSPIPVSPEGIDALLDLWPAFEAFQSHYVAGGLLLEQEKNVSAPSPTGTTAGAIVTAKPARKPARTARRG